MDGPGAVRYPEIILKISKDVSAFHLVTSVCRSMVRAGIERQIVAEAANTMTVQTVTPEEYLEKARQWITVVLMDEEAVPKIGDLARYAEMVNTVFGSKSSAV